ncbi:DUF4340 domain-containing protein [Butyrivibrio sp. AE2032]|uniref:DUF4340 domain-containing protein n=1 Tax=Butyrivibrio sp. AE2032 TaxID=1458463 RepID=UPI00054F1321|nr:DUF4340 domain-containing protein [Butyrivibrio sp. AE2032]
MKSVKNLLVPFIILIALIISVIVYFVVENATATDPEETFSGLIDVVYINSNDIDSVSVYNRDTGHTSIVKCTMDSSGIVNYEYQGEDANPSEYYSQIGLSDYVDLLSTFSCNSKVSAVGNYAEYGLDHPKYTVTIKALNGTVTTVFLGNKTPDGIYCYMYVSGSQDIYTVAVSKLEMADKTAISFLDTQVLQIDYYDLKTVHFDRKSDGLSLDANVVMTDSGIADFKFYKPYSHGSSPYFGNMIDKLSNLEISKYIEIDSQELLKYGLDDPEFHFIFTLNSGEQKELYFSKKVNGFFYGFLSGMDNYFMISELQLEGMEMPETVLIDPYIAYCYVKDISSITCKYGDRSFKLSLDVAEGRPITAEEARVELDGRNAKISDSDGRSYASILFESIACIKIGGADGSAVPDTSAGAVFSLSFVDKSYNTTLYDFYTRDDDSFYVFKNGEYMSFYVYSRELFNDGGRDTYSYGCWTAYELLSRAISDNINGIYDMPAEG